MQITDFAAFAAVIYAISTETDIVLALAEHAIFLAGAAGFVAIALGAGEAGCHRVTLPADTAQAKVTKVRCTQERKWRSKLLLM